MQQIHHWRYVFAVGLERFKNSFLSQSHQSQAYWGWGEMSAHLNDILGDVNFYAALTICESFATFIRDYRTFLGKKNIRGESRLDLKVVQYSQKL